MDIVISSTAGTYTLACRGNDGIAIVSKPDALFLAEVIKAHALEAPRISIGFIGR